MSTIFAYKTHDITQSISTFAGTIWFYSHDTLNHVERDCFRSNNNDQNELFYVHQSAATDMIQYSYHIILRYIYIYTHVFSRSFWLTFSKSLGPRQRRKPTPTHSATMRRAKLGKRTRRLVQARADFRSKLFRDFRVHGLTVPQAVSMWADRLCRHWYAAQAFSFALHASNYSWVFHSIP